MSWFWLNVPLAAAFVAAWTGIPLWAVLKHPDAGQHTAAAGRPAAAADRWQPSGDSRPRIPDRVLAR
jgi:hypothetical protein